MTQGSFFRDIPLLTLATKSVRTLNDKKSTFNYNCASVFIAAVIIFLAINFLVENCPNFKRVPSSIDLSSSDKELNTIGKIASWWLAKAYFANSHPPEVVILGSSQLGALEGADAYVYQRIVDITGDHRSWVLEHDLQGLIGGQRKVLIGGLPGMIMSDQLLISYALFSKQYKPELVAITFSPRDFIDDTCESITQTESFAFFSKHADLRPAGDLFNVKPTLTLSYIISVLPLRNILENLRSDFNGSISQQSYMIPMANPFERIVRGQIKIDPRDWHVFHDNAAGYRRKYKNALSPKFETQLSCLNLLLSYLNQQNIRTIAFNLPLTASNKKLLPDGFWKYYDNRVSEICRKNGADYVSVDRVVLPFKDDEFIDGAHLNFAGGHRLSKTVALFIANRFRQKPFQELLLRGEKCLK